MDGPHNCTKKEANKEQAPKPVQQVQDNTKYYKYNNNNSSQELLIPKQH